MKLAYTNENRIIVSSIKNILESNGVRVTLRNEFSSSAMGEVSPFDTWLELWVHSDYDYKRALIIIEDTLSEVNAVDWVCPNCKEENGADFGICWNCQQQSPT